MFRRKPLIAYSILEKHHAHPIYLNLQFWRVRQLSAWIANPIPEGLSGEIRFAGFAGAPERMCKC